MVEKPPLICGNCGNMETIEIDGAEILKFTIGASTYLLNPKEGARLINWNISMADGAVRDVIYWPENTPLSGKDFLSALGGMFVMFPFGGPSYGDGQKGFWKTPEGKLLPMKLHGYALDGNFEKSFASDTDIRLHFLPNAAAKEAYPYDYDFYVHYRFRELSFSCEMILANKSSVRIPWNGAMHPFFNLPWNSGTTRKDYRLLTDAKKAFSFDGASGSFSPADVFKTTFDLPEMVNKVWTSLKTSAVKFGPKNGEEDITVKIGDGGKPEVGTTVVTWSKSDGEPYYCVEPWMSQPTSAANPKHFAEPNSTKSFSVEFSLI